MMRLMNSLRSWKFVAFCSLVLCFAVTRAYSQDAVCPFADDDVVFYTSPNLSAKTAAKGAEKGDYSKEFQSLNELLDKADEKIQEALNKGDLPKKQVEYLIDLSKKASGENSAIRAMLKSYVTYVDYLYLAAELPENFSENAKNAKDDIPSGLTLTLVFNANPSELDPRRYFDEGDVEIIRENDKELVGKLLIKDKGEVKAVIFFGGTAVKDVDKYAIVASPSLDMVEKKVARFQQTNDVVVKNLEAGVLDKRAVKRVVFEAIVNEIDKAESKDERARTARDLLDKVNSLTTVTTASDNGLLVTISVEAVDSEGAQTINDLAAGGLAAVKLAGKNKENKKPEEELGLELLNKVSVSREDSVVKIQAEVGFDWIQKIIVLAREKNEKK